MKNKEHTVEFDDGLFKNLFLKFIQYKRDLGLGYKEPAEYNLRVINKKLNTFNLNSLHLTKEIVEMLAAKKTTESSVTQAKRITLLRQFALFMINMGLKAYVYPAKYMTHETKHFIPYIFTWEQIQALFKTTDSLRKISRYPQYHIIYPALVRMLYSCGLRLSEALCLKTNNVDLENGVLFIEKAKRNTSRLVPMSATLTKHCITYVQKMNLSSDGFFFPAPDRGKYHRGPIRSQIIKIYAKAGIPLLKNGLYPRVHDLRHTFCVHAMEQMARQGYDMYCSLPILSAYLGHKGLRGTERYIHLTDIKFADILESEKKIYVGVIPKVVSDE